MKKFSYEARDRTNDTIVKATVQADSEHSAAKLLLAQGLSPLNIKEDTSEDGFFARFSGRISSKDKTVFTRQLATLIGAGLPLSQALHTATEQTENKRFQGILQDIVSSVEGGKSLSGSFAKYPEVFDKVFLALVSAGEASGTLDESLRRVAEQEEKDNKTVSSIRGAMVYPMIVLVAIIGVMVFMMFTVVPQVEGLYKSLKKTLPFLTQMLINMSNFTIHYWWVVLLVLAVGIYFLRQYLKTDTGIKTKDAFKLNVPLFKGMFRRLYMARFSRTTQTLLNSGVSMLDTLRISGDALNNVIVQQSIVRAANKVKGGKELSAALQSEDYILPLVPQMIKIGEQSGKIDEMLGKVAQVYEDELDEQIKAISTAIEPILMVLMAIMAGGIVVAILFPIYSLVGGISV